MSTVRRLRRLAALAAALALAAGTGGPAVVAAGAEKEKPKPKELKISVKENRVFKFEKDLVTIKGTIQLVQGEVRLWAGEIVYDAKQKFATLAGEPKLVQEDLTLTGEKFSAWFDDEKYVIETGVKLVKPEKDPKQGDKLVVTCDRLEYAAQTKSMVATGNVTVKEKERTATAKTVHYADQESRVVLEGEVVINDKDDKTIRGEKVAIDLDKDLVEVEGPVEAEFKL